tara:strand:+ start:522 stop:710 length:189 start_codon:yes stop_codon:yes gene_type:complete
MHTMDIHQLPLITFLIIFLRLLNDKSGTNYMKFLKNFYPFTSLFKNRKSSLKLLVIGGGGEI